MKDQPKTLTPKLRFPEFVGQPLQKLQLGDVTAESTVRNGDTPPLGSVMGVTKTEGIVPMQERLIASDIARYKLVRKDWFAYNPMRLNIGSVARWKGDRDILVSPDYVVFKCLEEAEPAIDPGYLDHFRQADAWENFVTEGGDGSVRVRIYYEDIARLQLALLSPAEQRKIAACLTSLDELLAAQSRKLDGLRAHKKGLMQQLFPRAGESRPRLRFPEFVDKGEWVNEELSSCLDAVMDYRGKAPPKSGSGVPLITARNVRFGWLDMTEDEYIPENEYENWMSKGVPKAGDILFTTEAPLANVARFPDAGRFALGQRLLALRVDPAKCFHEFLFQSLLGPKMQEEINFRSTGSTAKGIKSSVFVTIGFCHPGIEEQQRIAACFGSVDALLAAASRKLNYLRAHKKGLMQQLFPSTEE